jgi:choline monooxygenase
LRVTALLEPWLRPQQLAEAQALVAPLYVAPSVFELEKRVVFARGWQLIAHLSQLQAVGDHVVAELAGLPVLAVRSAPDELLVMHNVCRHRAGPLLAGAGHAAKQLRCRYHGWTYGLDGVLRSAPEMQCAQNFDLGQVALPRLATRIWRGLLFACSDLQAAPDFEQFIEGMDDLVKQQNLAEYGDHRHVSYDIACNWKVYVDNYLEGYHVPHIHPGLNALLDYRSYVTETRSWYSYQYSPLESDRALYGSGDALYFWLWPNTMLNILPGRLQCNRVVPLAPDRCRVEFDYYYAAPHDQEAATRRSQDLSFSDQVQHEDGEICEAVQRGLNSGSYHSGRLNPLRENAVHHFHELLRSAYRSAE